MNRNPINNPYLPVYPREPEYDKSCPINTIYQSLPPTNPSTPVVWDKVPASPATIKHLYSPLPNHYPPQEIMRPVNTLYGHDFSQFHTTGVGKGKRISYHYKPYPFTDRNVRETRKYADYILPYMDFRSWTKHPVIRETSLNSPLQYEPSARYPKRRR